MMRKIQIAAAGLLMAIASPLLAHGLLVSVEADGNVINGKVYYSDGTPGAGEFIELRDLNRAENGATQEQSTATDAGGKFSFTGILGHQYAVVAHGEEGHVTEMQITLASGESGRLIDTPPASGGQEGPGLPPAWMIIGGLLLLSLIPALYLRRARSARQH